MSKDKNKKPVLGIIGGSGLYKLDNLEEVKWKLVNSPFGKISNKIMHSKIDDIKIRFLPRHVEVHIYPPTYINFKANIDALKKTGVTDIISVSAVGSLNKKYKPGSFVLIDQFIDRTVNREKSFFGPGCVAHVSMANPISKQLSDIIFKSKPTNLKIHRGGTYLAMEGPQFSTIAESNLYRSWGCDVIGMTNLPEAKLAREAELGYATIAMVTDFDCWHPDHDAVTVSQIIKIMNNNTSKVKDLLNATIKNISHTQWDWTDETYTVLDNSIITPEKFRDKNLMKKLETIVFRSLKT